MATVVSPPASAVVASPSVAPPPPLLLRKFTVDEYHLMARNGVFVDGDPFELLEGWIVKKMTRNPPHDLSIELINYVLVGLLPTGWRVRSQLAWTALDSEPEPDFAVVRGPIARPPLRHPGPGDTGLLIEVADTTLQHDRTVKGRIYARAGVVEYWIVNLNDAQLEVYTQPSGDVAAPAYQQLQTFRAGQAVPLILDGQQLAAIPVQDLLP